MKLTPLLIKKQEFSKSMRGFNVEEVQAFLDKLSVEVENLLRENEELKAEVENLREKVADFQKIEKNLQDTLIKAQDSSSKALESTKKQTSLMIKEAEIKASQLIENAKESANDIRNAVMTLREEKDLIIARLKAIVNSQSNLLEGKVRDAGEEPVKSKKQDASDKVDIDVNDIVDKLL